PRFLFSRDFDRTLPQKQALLSRLRAVWRSRLCLATDDEDSSDEDDDMSYVATYLALASQRYIARRVRVERPPYRVNYYLNRMPDSEFKLQFPMTRPFFLAVYRPIGGYREFQSVLGKQQRSSVELHVMGLLRTLWSLDGQGHSADYLSVGGHTPESLLAKRVVRALLAVKSEPEHQERREISEIIKVVSGFPNCIGLIDGTLFPLSQSPEDHGEDYFSRKSTYAINGRIVCDDRERIRYENIGWPGSSHDNRVWRNCKVALHSDGYFGENEYILGDSAYQPSSVLIPAYKKTAGGQLSDKENTFNTQLAKIRIRVEHCIGVLKGRFPLLKRLRARLRNENELKAAFSLIRAATILHNMAIIDPVPEGWVEREQNDDDEPEDLPSSANENRRAYLDEYVFDSRF
ncbi:hypothetical protein PHMEG_00032363, partial [Phytophthora megakarya]